MRGLIIRSPWIDLILAGMKTWEMRTKSTSIRGRIMLIKAGSGLIYGTAELIDSLPVLSREELRGTQSFHGITEEILDEVMRNRWTTPWVLHNIIKLETPIPYSHPKGAVTWVDLPDMAMGEIRQMEKRIKPNDSKKTEQTLQPLKIPSKLEHIDQTIEWADIPLTEGNIRNGHFRLRYAQHLLPNDCIGGSNKNSAAKNIRVQCKPGMLVECDIAGDKMILRARSQVRDFFDRTGAKSGDFIRFNRVNDHDFIITLRRGTEARAS